jgi:hypothetical protein
MHTYDMTDKTGNVCCPKCRGVNLRYCTILRPRLLSKKGRVETTNYFGDLRDYWCKDCDVTWLIAENDCNEEY